MGDQSQKPVWVKKNTRRGCHTMKWFPGFNPITTFHEISDFTENQRNRYFRGLFFYSSIHVAGVYTYTSTNSIDSIRRHNEWDICRGQHLDRMN